MSRQEAAFYRGLFHNNASGMARFDATLCICDVNDALASLMGYTRRQLLKKDLLRLIDVDDQPRMKVLFDAMRAGRLFDGGVEFTLWCRNAVRRLMHAAPTAIRADDGSFTHGILVLTDITARRAAEEALRQQIEFEHTLLNKTSALIVVYDPRGIVRHISPAVEKLFGYTLEEVRGQNMWNLGVMTAEEQARSKSRLRELNAGAESISSTMRLRNRAGEELAMEIISTAVRKPDGGVDCIIATGTEVTGRLRFERHVLRAVEAEQTRVGRDLHDGVGQSLAGLVSLVEALTAHLNGTLKEEAARVAVVLQDAVQNVRRLCHDMSPTSVRQRSLSDSLLLLARTTTENFRVECSCELEDLPLRPETDSQAHLFRIAQEALSNALRHGHATKVKIILKRTAEDEAELTIRDNGTGVSPGNRNPEDIGLRLMEYRSGLIGGNLKTSARPGRGVTVTCRFSCLKKQNSPEVLTAPVNAGKNREL